MADVTIEVVETTIELDLVGPGAALALGAATRAEAAQAASETAAANATATSYWPERPNAFLPQELNFSLLDGWALSGATLARTVASDGGGALLMTVAAGGFGSAFRRFKYSELKSGKVSAALQALSVSATGGAARFRLIYRNAAGTQLGFDSLAVASATGLTFDAARTLSALADKTPTSGAVAVDFYIDLANTVGVADRTMVFRKPVIAEGVSAAYRAPSPAIITARKTVWLATATGSDFASGKEGRPLATAAAALAAIVDAGGVGEIRFPGGVNQDITAAALSQAGVYSLRMAAPPDSRVRFFGGTVITGWSKTPGYTNVYEAVVSASLLTNVTFIYQYGAPDALTEIAMADRHSLQRGQQYRLPEFTRVWPTDTSAPVTSNGQLDAAPRPSHWHDGTKLYGTFDDGTGTLGGDPADFTIRIPSRSTNLFAAATGVQELEMIGIEVHGHRHGLWAYYRGHARYEDCAAFACGQDGFRLDDSRVEAVRLRAGGNGNDGLNQTGNSALAISSLEAASGWCFDNYDDGASPHNQCYWNLDNFLIENNNSRGLIGANGSRTVGRNILSRLNRDEGIGIAGIAADGGGTLMAIYTAISQGNAKNFSAGYGGGTDSHLRLYSPQSIAPMTPDLPGQPAAPGSHYYAADGAVVDLYGMPLTEGAGIVKDDAGDPGNGVAPGTINVHSGIQVA